MRRGLLCIAVGLGAAFVLGCAPDEAAETALLGRHAQAIVGGSVDNEHRAVVAIETSTAHCTGTIVSTSPGEGTGVALTAAHCMDGTTPAIIVQGVSLTDFESIFEPTGFLVHPEWIAGNPSYDFALVQFEGVSEGTPFIPVLRPQDDELVVGQELVSVGFGASGGEQAANNSPDLMRRAVSKKIFDISATHIVYEQLEESGLCDGDSGGPALVETPNGLRVAGVHAYITGDSCTDAFAISGRVSGVVKDFVNTADDFQQVVLTCDDCYERATGPIGRCALATKNCDESSACAAFDACAAKCDSTDCVSDCANTHPQGADLFVQAQHCVCEPDECGQICGFCGSYGQCGYAVADTSEACTRCAESECCSDGVACAEDGQCSFCAGEDCLGSDVYQQWGNCLTTRCADLCDLGFSSETDLSDDDADDPEADASGEPAPESNAPDDMDIDDVDGVEEMEPAAEDEQGDEPEVSPLLPSVKGVRDQAAEADAGRSSEAESTNGKGAESKSEADSVRGLGLEQQEGGGCACDIPARPARRGGAVMLVTLGGLALVRRIHRRPNRA